MSSRPLHTRRQALGLLGALLATGAVTGLVGCKRRSADDQGSADDPVLKTRTHTEAAEAIGAAWLEQDGKASADELAERFLGGASLADYEGKPDQLRAKLHERIRRDFVERRTAKLDGWLLSRTELDVYAYVAVVG